MLKFIEINSILRSLTAETPDGGMCQIQHGGKYVDDGFAISVNIYGKNKIYPHTTISFNSEIDAVNWANEYLHNAKVSGAGTASAGLPG